jgi:hypothetical protein
MKRKWKLCEENQNCIIKKNYQVNQSKRQDLCGEYVTYSENDKVLKESL